MKFKQPVLLRVPFFSPSGWVKQQDWDSFLARYRHALRVVGFERMPDRHNVSPETGEMWLQGKYSQDVKVTALTFSVEEVYYFEGSALIHVVMKKLADRNIVEISTLPEQPLTKLPAWADPHIEQYVEK